MKRKEVMLIVAVAMIGACAVIGTWILPRMATANRLPEGHLDHATSAVSFAQYTSVYMQHLSSLLSTHCLKCHAPTDIEKKSGLAGNPYWIALRDRQDFAIDPLRDLKAFSDVKQKIGQHIGYYHLPTDDPSVMARYRSILQSKNLVAGSNDVENWESGITVDGGIVFRRHCKQCHDNANAAGVPQIGDRDHWNELLAKEPKSQLISDAIKGEGGMPPRGGVATLTDEAVTVAADFLVTGKSPAEPGQPIMANGAGQ